MLALGSESSKKVAGLPEGTSSRKLKVEEGKTGKASKSEELEGEKSKSKPKTGDRKSNGHGSAEHTEVASKSSKSNKKSKHEHDHDDSQDEETTPAKQQKPSKPTAVKPADSSSSSSSEEEDSEDSQSSPHAQTGKDAKHATSKRPSLPPKPTKPTPVASSSTNPNAAVEKKKTAKETDLAEDSKPSDEASELSSSEDSSVQDAVKKPAKAVADDKKSGKSGKNASLASTNNKPSSRQLKKSDDDEMSSEHPPASSEDSPERASSPTNATSSKASAGSKPPTPGVGGPDTPAVSTATTSTASSSHEKDKKKGIFSFLKRKDKKDTKPKDGHANNAVAAAGAPVHVKRSKDASGGHKEGTPDKKRDEEKKTYVVSSVAELPEEWQKKLRKLHLEEPLLNQNFAILCNVLHFLTKDSFKMPEQTKDVRERRPYASTAMMDAAKLLLDTTDNIKKFYKNIEFSGKGGFGRVFAAKDIATKKRVAIKKLPHEHDKDKKNNYCEIAFLSTCNHPNIVKFNKAWDFPDKGEAWIVTEFLEGGTLSEAVKVHQFTERHIAYVAREILKALKYLHSLGYIHRDLKSGNVMMSIEGQIKLIDFGLCCDTVDGERLQMLGSPYWIPPEMIKKKRHGCPADIWSFAVCVLEMYLKEPPNCDSRLYAMFTAASSGLQSAIPARASDSARDFLSKCLEINPKKRWTADQLLAHPFVTAPKLEEGIRDVLRGVFVSNSLALSGI